MRNSTRAPARDWTAENVWIDEKRLPRWIGSRLPRWDTRVQITTIVGVLVAVTGATYAFGGTHTSAPQAQYLAIILGAFWFGVRGGVIAGLIAGLAIGPFMPLNVDTGQSQQTLNWLLRVGIFVMVGGFSGWLATSMRLGIDELARLGAETIHSFVRTIDIKSSYTAEHSEKVADYAAEIATALDLPRKDVERIYWSALIHDIGKIQVPKAILDKTTGLDRDEWAIIQQHPEQSVEILQGVKQFESFLPAIRSHHERWDGRGYPDGLKGEQIPFEARILCVADAFDAMTSSRPYRAAMSEEDALNELRANAGIQFDPSIVEAFIRGRNGDSGLSSVT